MAEFRTPNTNDPRPVRPRRIVMGDYVARVNQPKRQHVEEADQQNGPKLSNGVTGGRLNRRNQLTFAIFDEDPTNRLLVNMDDLREQLFRLMDPTSMTLSRPKILNKKHQFNQLFSADEVLGRGGSSVVYAGERRSDGLPVVIKRIKAGRRIYYKMDGGKPVILEAAVLEHLNRPGSAFFPGISVPRLIGTYRIDKDVFVVLEGLPESTDLQLFCAAANLKGRQRLSENLVRHFVLNLHAILTRLSSIESIYHGDVKDMNVLVNLEDYSLQLIDFDMADFYNRGHRYRSGRGTWHYLPPEHHAHKIFKADAATTYALGVMMYRMLSGGQLPFENKIEILGGGFAMPIGLSAECEDVLRACLAKEEERVAFTEMTSMAWFQEPIDMERIKQEGDAIKAETNDKDVFTSNDKFAVLKMCLIALWLIIFFISFAVNRRNATLSE